MLTSPGRPPSPGDEEPPEHGAQEVLSLGAAVRGRVYFLLTFTQQHLEGGSCVNSHSHLCLSTLFSGKSPSQLLYNKQPGLCLPSVS